MEKENTSLFAGMKKEIISPRKGPLGWGSPDPENLVLGQFTSKLLIWSISLYPCTEILCRVLSCCSSMINGQMVGQLFSVKLQAQSNAALWNSVLLMEEC